MILETLMRTQVSPPGRHVIAVDVTRETCGRSKARRAHRRLPGRDGRARRRSTTLAESQPDFRGGECLARRGTTQYREKYRLSEITGQSIQIEALIFRDVVVLR